MLYDHIYSKPNELGMSNNWELMETLLEESGWQVNDVRLLVHGRTFVEYAETMLPETSGSDVSIEAFWEYVRPNATCAEAGWLGIADIEQLQQRLQGSESVLSRPTTQLAQANTIRLAAAFESTRKMLGAAKVAQTGLFLVIAG
jgi:hypothetical protein